VGKTQFEELYGMSPESLAWRPIAEQERIVNEALAEPERWFINIALGVDGTR